MFSTGLSLKERLAKATAPLVGGFVFSTDSNICEVYAEAKFDFVVIDMEHALNDLRTVHSHLRACAATGIATAIRLGVGNFPDVARLLDNGAEAFMFPHLGRAGYGSDDAIAAMRYPPAGDRPTCTGVQSAGYGLANFSETVRRANRDVLAIGLVEDRECVERIDTILDESGVDWIMPGPGDLASSYGVHGRMREPVVVGAVTTVIEAAKQRNVPVGVYVSDASELANWLGHDPQFVIYSLDYKVLGRALGQAIGDCRAQIQTAGGRG